MLVFQIVVLKIQIKNSMSDSSFCMSNGVSVIDFFQNSKEKEISFNHIVLNNKKIDNRIIIKNVKSKYLRYKPEYKTLNFMLLSKQREIFSQINEILIDRFNIKPLASASITVKIADDKLIKNVNLKNSYDIEISFIGIKSYQGVNYASFRLEKINECANDEVSSDSD